MIGRLIESIRCNHALEHATVSLLLARIGPRPLVGQASERGFFIFGDVPAETLAECAREGLARLQRGESHWAVTPLCGTNIVTTGVLAGLSTLAVAGSGPRSGRVSDVILAGMLAVVVAQPIGRLIQRHITTSPNLADTEIVAIDSRPGTRLHRVHTRRSPA